MYECLIDYGIRSFGGVEIGGSAPKLHMVLGRGRSKNDCFKIRGSFMLCSEFHVLKPNHYHSSL